MQIFERNLERNIFYLHRQLLAKTYRHSDYSSFYIHDPKVRHIRKACVRDRLVHQTAYTSLTQIFDPKLIRDVYSSRLGKGTHRAVKILRGMSLKVSRNLTRDCWALKCDVRRFYDTVDHEILIQLLKKTIDDEDAIWLLREIIDSFQCEGTPGKGLPIGNLTSQIFTNVYLGELDRFIKHELRMKYYLRFADDLLILSHSKSGLEDTLLRLKEFLRERLQLEFHPKKVTLKPLCHGVDFLGYVTLPHHRVLRTTTRRRMRRRLTEKLHLYHEGAISGDSFNQTVQSYLGLLSHADHFELESKIRNEFCWG